MLSLTQETNNEISSVGSDNQDAITCSEILDTLKTLKHNKRHGYSGIISDHVINACDKLAVHLSLLFSSLIMHGTATDDLSCSSMLPISKGGNSNITSFGISRAITLSSSFGKLSDCVVLNRYGDHIGTSHLQFGFKKNHSATMCSLVLKETN